ncbi:uncharacterized protein E0L32_003515 [Thyridium curvatum]|uniref:LysM domain-containing protein n=1 Tax=Thyridium curvatum TaxID=1093900 RepID=A0A507BBR9_9PEZI|nr:uncharacterized protein E0L32_003515 [Thyridium curvatum]TPX16953.1 hypothetical protein E0L32_003515 [Thyridium curvatum]
MRVDLRSVLLVLAGSAVAQSYIVDPPTTAPSDTTPDCTYWHVGAAGDTCEAIATDNFIQLSWLYRWNPSLANGCNVIAGTSYCVEENWGVPPVDPTTTTSTTTTPTSTGIVTPTPTQPPEIVAGCTKLHFVSKGTSCSSILSQYGITVAQFYAWNSGVGADCSGMWAEVYVCVAGPGFEPTTTTGPGPTTTGGNGIVTPSPTQPPSITPNCNKFYFVNPGTSCSAVLSQNGITIAQLYAWNEGVGADCSGLWASVYVCVGVIGGGGSPTTTSKPTTTSGNGITTPTPTQPGMTANCDKFHFVAQGQSCASVLAQYSLPLATFYSWNTGVGSQCENMWANVYVCVHAIGAVIPTSTTTKPTTTKGNGVATPTPTQPGMVTNCNKFYKVVDGDTCDVITSKTKVSKANLQRWNTQIGDACNVWLGYYLCIGVI